ncbi:cortexin domain-containing 1-like protein [Lates japonicus]|uniref:Cortexin domain-containing 1-like protein n=1 Tax=Lates japonicus TaxID=270547 RepID=A0AAD3RCT5_LATJO|nr:cortexin domain-containing 1-like protein [Lates japonicus]
MDPPMLPVARLDVDVDLGFALFFFFLLCFFLLATIIRCAQMNQTAPRNTAHFEYPVLHSMRLPIVASR